MRLLTILLFMALATPPLAGQTTQPTRAIRAGTLIDGTGAPPRHDVVIIIQGERIVSVQKELPDEAVEVIDLSGWTVLPGLIDTHVHLTVGPKYGYLQTRLHERPGYVALVGARNAWDTLLAGFTTVRDLGIGGWMTVALRDAVAAGVVPGPRILTAAHLVGSTGSHCDLHRFQPEWSPAPGVERGVADGAEQIRVAVRHQIKHGADWIKTCATGGVASPNGALGAQQYTGDELRVLVETATMGGKKVAAHAYGLEGIEAAVRAGAASIEHGSMLDEETARLMRSQGTFLVPTLTVLEQSAANARAGKLPPATARKAEDAYRSALEGIALAIRVGTPIAFGTDAGVVDHGSNATEFRLLVEAGMTPLQAIDAATRNAAELLGQAQDLGTVEPGKLADLVATKGNPLQDIGALGEIAFVMKGGKLYLHNGVVAAVPGPQQ